MLKHCANVVRALIVVTAGLALSACATATTTVLAPASGVQPATYASIQLQPTADTVPVPAAAQTHFRNRLNEYLFAKDSRFKQGEDLTIRYRFIQFDEGNRALRYLIGMGAGKGTMTVEIVFLDKQQKELAKINVGGELSMGVLGGDFDEAISRAAREVADYAAKTF